MASNPRTQVEEICESLYGTGLNDGKHGIHYFPTPVQFRVNQLLSLIATIRKEALKKGFTNGYNKGRVRCLQQHYKDELSALEDRIREEERQSVLRKVEDILPYGAGFTGRFYTLKDELSHPPLKGTDE